MSLYVSKVSEGLIQHVLVKKCQDEKMGKKKPPYELYEGKHYYYIFLIISKAILKTNGWEI